MEVGCEEVGVVDLNRKLNEDIVVSETGLLEPARIVWLVRYPPEI